MSGKPKHGMHKTREHKAWQKMKDRCYNPNSQRYNRYGARGIRVCDEWVNSFESFYRDMGSRPTADHSLERIDNDGDYCPENCKWATKEEQNRNRGDNVRLTCRGKTMTLSEWSREVGIGCKTLSHRLKVGWDIEDALYRPVEKRTWKKSPSPGGRVPVQSGEVVASNRMVNGYRDSWAGENCPKSKLTWEQVACIREACSTGGVPQNKLARVYGVSATSINRIVLNKNWKQREDKEAGRDATPDAGQGCSGPERLGSA